MKILYICEEYPPGKNGGIGTVVRLLGREMVKQGNNVYVVGLYPHGYGGKDYEEDEGVKVWRIRYKTDIGLFRGTWSITDKLIWAFLKHSYILDADVKTSTARLFSFINKLIADEKIDIVEIPDWNSFLHNSSTTIQFPRLKIPLIVKFHGSHSYTMVELNDKKNNYVFNSEQALLKRADALASVSEYTAKRTTEIFGLKMPVKVLYNGIPVFVRVRDTGTAAIQNKIIFTGSLIRKKGIHQLLRAWNIVAPQINNIQLHIFGKGLQAPLKKELSEAATKSVFFHGHVSQEVLYKELSSSIAAVFPSYSECFAMAPLEAMASGCAVINTSRSSGKELITDGENGLLIDPDDIEGIADSIILLCNNEVLRKKIALAGKKTVLEKFNIQHSVIQHIDFYSEVIVKFKEEDAAGKNN